jgi:hypothetical protein
MSVIHRKPCISERSRSRREPEHACLPSTLNARILSRWPRSTIDATSIVCLIAPGWAAGSADCSNHFDATIAGKTYVKLNDLGCERIVGAGRPRMIIF